MVGGPLATSIYGHSSTASGSGCNAHGVDIQARCLRSPMGLTMRITGPKGGLKLQKGVDIAVHPMGPTSEFMDRTRSSADADNALDAKEAVPNK